MCNFCGFKNEGRKYLWEGAGRETPPGQESDVLQKFRSTHSSKSSPSLPTGRYQHLSICTVQVSPMSAPHLPQH